LGLLTCKNRLPYNLYCVGGDVKHCSLTHSLIPLMLSLSGKQHVDEDEMKALEAWATS